MHPNTARLKELMGHGYELDAIQSDEGALDVTMRKRDHVVRLRFLREEAAELLLFPRVAPGA